MSLEGFEFAPVNDVPSLVICESPIFYNNQTNNISYIGVDAHNPIEEVPVKVGHSAGEYVGSALMFSIGAIAMISRFSKRDKVFQREYIERNIYQSQ